MTPTTQLILTVCSIHVMGLVSPGPDFAMILRNSLIHGRRSGVIAALGIAVGLMVHITYCILGLAAVLKSSPFLYQLILYLGGGYLIYIGLQSFGLSVDQILPKFSSSKTKEYQESELKKELRFFESFRIGFVTNLLNPKATLYILGLFTHLSNSKASLNVQIICGLWMVLFTFLWFAFVANALNARILKNRLLKFQSKIEKVMGMVLIALGVKILWD